MATEVATQPNPSGAQANPPSKSQSGNPYASASLYVGDLDRNVTESHLFELFNAVGPVASIRVCRDSQTRQSLGYAYVNFHSVNDAERALDTMNFNQIRGRPCRIMWSQRDPSLRKSGEGNVFVKNLHKNITDQQLFDTFSVFGNILSCKVARNDAKESLEYGYVHYADPESAAKAIENVNGMMIANKTVSAELFKPRSMREQNRKWTNVYFKHIPEAMDEAAFVAFVLEKMGMAEDVITVDNNTGKKAIYYNVNPEWGGAFCCINFQTHDDAFRTVTDLNGYRFEDQPQADKTLYAARAEKKKFRRGKSQRRRFNRWKGGINLYVKNLDESIRDDDLKQIFASYGQITSARVMLDRQTGKSRGFGFVCFARKEDAVRAMSEMNSKEYRGKALYVSRAQLKVARQQWLAKQRMRYNYPSYQNNFRTGPMTNQGGGSFLQPPTYRGVGGGRQFPQASQMYPQNAMYPGRYPQQQPMMNAMQPFPQMAAPVRQPNIQMQPPTSGYMTQPIRGPTSNPTATSGSYQNITQIPPHPSNPMNMHTGSVPQVGSVPTQQGVSVPTQTGGVQSQPQPLGYHRQQRISPEDLANKTAAERKRIIGEQLFPRIQQVEPRLAGKITGMLLEMDDKELLVLLESSEALVNKVNEALQVLREHQAASAGNTAHRE